MGAQGICFAVASNTAEIVLAQLIRYGRVRRARLGLAGQKVAVPRRLVRRLGLDQDWGVLVSDVASKGPADRAGLQNGDVLVKLDGRAITGVDELLKSLTNQTLDRVIAVSIVRNGGLMVLDVQPTER
jgi:S1-C subfamily serine protease